jgi:hypothetical protein
MRDGKMMGAFLISQVSGNDPEPYMNERNE